MASDHIDSARYTSESNGSNVHLSLGFKSNEHMESIFEKLQENCEVTMALNDTFWGERFGMISDKYGFKWMFSFKSKNV